MWKRRNIIPVFFEAIYGALTPEKTAQADKTFQAFKSFRAKARAQRTLVERAADAITGFFGSIPFAILHVFWFVFWILANNGYFPGITVFDPFPYGLLTMVVSLEAIFLSVFVLISQNRESQITDLRSEIDFHVNMQAEQEVTKMLHMVEEIYEHLGLSKKKDKELEAMKQPIDPDKIAEEIKKEEAGS